jgi:hypothetical protein
VNYATKFIIIHVSIMPKREHAEEPFSAAVAGSSEQFNERFIISQSRNLLDPLSYNQHQRNSAACFPHAFFT